MGPESSQRTKICRMSGGSVESMNFIMAQAVSHGPILLEAMTQPTLGLKSSSSHGIEIDLGGKEWVDKEAFGQPSGYPQQMQEHPVTNLNT